MPSYRVVTPEGKVCKARRKEVQALRWLPEKVEIPLRRIAEAARKGLMALCVQVGLAVLQATMENEVTELVGPKGKHRADRQAYRHGHEPGWAVMARCKVRNGASSGAPQGPRSDPPGKLRLGPARRQPHRSGAGPPAARGGDPVLCATSVDVGEVESFGTCKSRVGARFIRQMDAKLRGWGEQLAFLKAKGKDGSTNAHEIIYQHLSNWLREKISIEGDMMEWIVNTATSQQYRLATMEALAFLQRLKRFAEAELRKGGVMGYFRSSAILPLPGEVQRVAQNGNRCENISLWLDRFLTVDQKTWELTQYAKRRERVTQLANASRLQGCVSALQRRCEAILRWHKQRGLIVKSFEAKPVWRFVVGLGAAHVLETGITLHRLFGLPIIPGSALKGAARAYAKLVEGKSDDDPEVVAVFGTTQQAGGVVFLDAVPIKMPRFQLDIMNLHYPNYYRTQGVRPPAGWESPTPVFFLTVQETPYQFALAARNEEGSHLLNIAERWLRGALSELGIGAKTSAGYGCFQ